MVILNLRLIALLVQKEKDHQRRGVKWEKRCKVGAWLTKARRSMQEDEQEQVTQQQLMEREMEQ